jgi:hypothetical protein
VDEQLMVRARKSPGSGGSRVGKPGANYQNRTDLPGKTQPITVASGQEYGTRGAQEDAQRAIPLPAGAPPPAPTSLGSVTAGPITPLDAPTQRPNEPLTHGLPIGAGGGPEVLGGSVNSNDPVLYLEGLYQSTNDPSVYAMLQEARTAKWNPNEAQPL